MNVLPVAKVADTAGDLYRSSKTLANGFKYIETAKDTLKTAGRTTLNKATSAVNRVLDAPLPVGRQFAPTGGPSIGTSTNLRELSQNAKSTMTSLFIRHGDDVGEGVGEGKASSNVTRNKQQGKMYEDAEFPKFKDKQPDAVREITVKTNTSISDGTRIRLDGIGHSSDGKLHIVEYKSSDLAPLTKNQQKGFTELEQYGGTIVGKGKEPFVGGTVIKPGTIVEIIRPS